MLRILGIDPGLVTGLAEIDYDKEKEKITAIGWGAVNLKTSSKDPLHYRLYILEKSLEQWIEHKGLHTEEIDVIGVEENFMPRGTSTVGIKACGVVESFIGKLAYDHIPLPLVKVYNFPPASIKKVIMGKGNASRKDFTKFMWDNVIGNFFNREKEEKKFLQHKVDALAVALTALKKEVE